MHLHARYNCDISTHKQLKKLMQEKGIFEYFKEGVTLKYMDFSGRARRREYWSYTLCAFVIGFVAGLIDGSSVYTASYLLL